MRCGRTVAAKCGEGHRRLRSRWWLLVGLVAAAFLIGHLQGVGPTVDDSPAPPGTTVTTGTDAAGSGGYTMSDLPKEARATVALIDSGGPYPYAKDGSVFGNRERLLPNRPRGYYREFTVRTPGSSDRGPRRLISGAEGEIYYTNDHYASFHRVERN